MEATEVIHVQAGDVIGIDYENGQSDGVIPYEHLKDGADTSTMTDGLTEDSLSTLININRQYVNMPVGYEVTASPVTNFKRIPALKPVFVGMKNNLYSKHLYLYLF